MRNFLLAIILLLLPSATLLAVSYEVTIEEDRPRFARVEARLTPLNDRILLSRNARDTGLYHGWATFVHRIEAVDSSNNPVSLRYVTEGYWELGDHHDGPVTVSYVMLLQHDRFPNDPGDDELAWARDWGVMWTGRALFLEGADVGEISLKFNVPKDWKISTPWLRSGHAEWNFLVPDYDELLDAAFVAGLHKEVVIGDENAPSAVLAFGGESAIEASDLVTGVVERSMSSFSALFGAPPAKQMFLVSADGSFWGGGVMGSSISMLMGGPMTEETVPMMAYITTHEMFHLWNSNFNLSGHEDVDALQWFGEGAAEYYTWLYSVRNDLVDTTAFLSELGNRYGQYLAARTDMSMSAAGKVKLDHYNLIYSGGMMAVAALDLQIRSASRGARSMDDVLRLLQSRFPGNGDLALSADDLPAVVREATGIDVSAIFDQYIFGNDPLPMDEFLGLAGLALTENTPEGSFTVSRTGEPSNRQAGTWQSLVSED